MVLKYNLIEQYIKDNGFKIKDKDKDKNMISLES